MHEDMHGEALTYTRQTLGYPAPKFSLDEPPDAPDLADDVCDEDVFVPGGRYDLGAEPGALLVFDNEKWAHLQELPPFAIARTPVTNAQFAAFVDDGGYHDENFWSEESWLCRQQARASVPRSWLASGCRWLARALSPT